MAVGVGITGTAVANHGTAPIVVAADGSGDYTSIQEAVNHANAGDRIEVQSGTYDGAVVNKSVTIDGEGAPRIQTLLNLTASGATVRDIVFESTYSDAPMTLYGDGTVATNITMDVGTEHGASIDIQGDNAVLNQSELTRAGDESFAFIEVFEGPNSVQATGAPRELSSRTTFSTAETSACSLKAGGRLR